jgi:hypothetical protein
MEETTCNAEGCTGQIAQHVAMMREQTLFIVMDNMLFPADPWAMSVFCDQHAAELTQALVLSGLIDAWQGMENEN